MSGTLTIFGTIYFAAGLSELTGLINKTGPSEKASKNIAFSAFKA
jgi:hypothetical protein